MSVKNQSCTHGQHDVSERVTGTVHLITLPHPPASRCCVCFQPKPSRHQSIISKVTSPCLFFSFLSFNQTGQTSVLMLWSGCLFTLERSPLQLSETHPLPPQVVISVLPGRRILKVCPDPTCVFWLIFNVKMKQSNDLRPWWTQCEQSLNPETVAD